MSVETLPYEQLTDDEQPLLSEEVESVVDTENTDVDELSEDEIEALTRLNQEEVDKQILGKSVRVIGKIDETARQAMSAGDKMLAHVRNIPGSPRKYVRQKLMNRAQNRLVHKEQRLSDKQMARKEKYDDREAQLLGTLQNKREQDQLKIDATSSELLKRHRQNRADKKHETREAKVRQKLTKLEQKHTSKNSAHTKKVEKYRSTKADARTERYNTTAKLHSERLAGASNRAEGSSEKITAARKEALAKREQAIARKELRLSLRLDHGASRRERRAVINEILGDGDNAASKEKLASIGRKLVESQMLNQKESEAYRDQSSLFDSFHEIKQKLSDSQIALEKLPAFIAEHETKLDETNDTIQNRQMVLSQLRERWEVRLSEGGDSIDFMERARYHDAIKLAESTVADAMSERDRTKHAIELARDQLASLPEKINNLQIELFENEDAIDASIAQSNMFGASQYYKNEYIRDETQAILNGANETPRT